ncbi:hypothetical protein E3Q18_00823 [Wallemia mellicola]|uniref:Uncharacterized protein n=3 Tax=Wallemia mellicola TaxID=1708541 RepID=A0A4T0NBB0_9BASI|nr:hypothetical protein E3Q23_00588 [Wallemia mellicola]TIB90391.1 hypothetical protein E3Q21_00206 [Wallemia mellicola]TIB92213.1 hypothetical protein E3Q20_00474 [Wallemia mellicola]TIB93921.1 hypothetical protein E3Q19_00816 [Wallemia mellicola]TIC01164.1 hypothetical protein E3Q18_00823 [Wallemia mellicola]
MLWRCTSLSSSSHTLKMLNRGVFRNTARLCNANKDKFVESLKAGSVLEEPTSGISPHEKAQDAREAKDTEQPGPTLADLEKLSAEDLGGGEIGERALGEKGEHKKD